MEFLDTIPSVGLFNIQGNVPTVFLRSSNPDYTLILVDCVSIGYADSLNDVKINDALLKVGLSQMDDENITDKFKHTSKDIFAIFIMVILMIATRGYTNWLSSIINLLDFTIPALFIAGVYLRTF